MIEVPHFFEVVREINRQWMLSREASEREADAIHCDRNSFTTETHLNLHSVLFDPWMPCLLCIEGRRNSLVCFNYCSGRP